MKLIIILIVLLFNNFFTQTISHDKKTFGETGVFSEEFVYDVNWGFINLGKIIIQAYKDFQSTDSAEYILSMHIISNPSIPFVNINEYNETLVSIKNFYSKKYSGLHQSSNEKIEIKTSYNCETRTSFYSFKNLKYDLILKQDSTKNVPPYLDGPSLFYFTRFNIHSGKSITFPTMVNGELHDTHFNFKHPKEKISIEAIQGPILAKKYSGVAEWKGGTSAGLTGEFCGWISDDEASVILKSEVKVWIGSISIELVKWYKPSWKPQANNFSSSN